ncbi:putative tat pathway signal sequence protein [Rosellinia necatrix]|uniref:endo-1,3(4)-beta-glucanase n=1 Tax=Rosellinia necatrix TaxID=77044 RepID=A0A1W2TDT0_ROSNE|nr:putative tat pathway signal sequence protein [Rosellinia necatrix]
MPFTSNLVRLGGVLSLAVAAQAQSYTIQDTFDASNFFENFEFFDGPDPTAGFVDYVDAGTANSTGLAGYANNGVYLGVDSQTMNPSAGRASVRVSTKKAYTHGLIVADIAHQPASTCGSWPAFWSFGPNWPHSGEIDIIEGVNLQSSSSITLHTAPGCTFSQDSFSSADCGSPGDGTLGCGASTGNSQDFGNGFNDIGGGVIALQWTSSAIKIFFFPRTGTIPADIEAGNPDPSTWGTPVASFSGGSCNIDANFMNHNIVFDTTFCGQWAGKVFGDDPTCAAKATTCEEYVGGNPADFQDSYWLINYVKVFGESSKKTIGKPFKA